MVSLMPAVALDKVGATGSLSCHERRKRAMFIPVGIFHLLFCLCRICCQAEGQVNAPFGIEQRPERMIKRMSPIHQLLGPTIKQVGASDVKDWAIELSSCIHN